MSYCAIQGYINGDPTKIWSATNENGNVCGLKGTSTENYPYAYFYNPAFGLSKRICIDSCPTFDASGALPATINSQPSFTGTWISVNADGSISGGTTPTASNGLKYDST